MWFDPKQKNVENIRHCLYLNKTAGNVTAVRWFLNNMSI